jgi:DNA repair protein RecO (recombination protein O)
MTRRITGEVAYVLHQRPYRETSALIDLLTLQHGCISVVGRGVRGGGRRQTRLQPFGRILIGCAGRTALMTLTSIEVVGHRTLDGRALFSALYLNELVLRLMKHEDAHPALFFGYEDALDRLMVDRDVEPVLRRFEKLLLQESGYEIDFETDAESGARIDSTAVYRFDPAVGFRRVQEAVDDRWVYSGATMMAISKDQFDDPRTRRAAKRLLRRALAPHIGDRPLQTRALFNSRRPA